MFMTKLPLPPSEEQMKLWFSLIEYDPDYVVLKKCNNRNGRIQTTTGLLPALLNTMLFISRQYLGKLLHSRMQELHFS
jgi:hypothetical protein